MIFNPSVYYNIIMTKTTYFFIAFLNFFIQIAALLYSMYINNNTEYSDRKEYNYSILSIDSWDFYKHLRNYWRNSIIVNIIITLLFIFSFVQLYNLINTQMLELALQRVDIMRFTWIYNIIFNLILSRILFYFRTCITIASLCQWSAFSGAIALLLSFF